MATSDLLDVARANTEAERTRMLALLERGGDTELSIEDFLNELDERDARGFHMLIEKVMPYQPVALLLSIVGEVSPDVVDEVAHQMAEERYGPVLPSERTNANRRKGAVRNKTKGGTPPQGRSSNASCESFDRQIFSLILGSAPEGMRSRELMEAMDGCSKGRLRLSLKRLKDSHQITQHGKRGGARYLPMPSTTSPGKKKS